MSNPFESVTPSIFPWK
uniref:Uncharacterized protein n=1 Tax=Rhizophora mucronata TaxID=61149 RepID=A0A2P2QGU8_RHIMU